MNKADKKSKQYRDFREQCGINDRVMLNEIEEAYYEGYYQAEKDLELTWKDMLKIDEIISEVYKNSDSCQTEVIYQEVLKRFNKERKEK